MYLPYVASSNERPKQIGLIVLQADETLERDMRILLPAEVEYLVTRVPSDLTVTTENLQAMKTKLTNAASLLSQGASLSAVAYGCTSGSAQIGVGHIASLVQAGIKTPAVTEPVSACIAACRALNVTRIGLISPYIESVSEQLCSVLADCGIIVTHFASFNEPLEEKVVRISAASIEDAATTIGRNPDCEAVFLSCTNMRTLDVIERVEAQINKPVLSSNQVLAWHLGKLIDLGPAITRIGSLLSSID